MDLRKLVFKAALIAGLWALYGALMSVQSHYRFVLMGRPVSWGSAIMAEFSFAGLWALATPLVLWLAGRFPFGRTRWLWPCCIHLPACFVVACTTKATWDYLALPFIVAPAKLPHTLAEHASSILSALDYGFLQYLLILVCHHAIDYYHRYEQGRMRASELEAQLANAQLKALKMQLHPHFLFNTLHAIAELVHQEPAAAERMITLLSDFLRLTIDHVGVPEVTLGQEVEFLKRYLEIEKMRFEERLHVDFEIEAATRFARVPNLVLQPIVENALRHGLGNRTNDGLLRVRCQKRHSHLVLAVFDNGPGADLSVVPLREGVGLTNTRKRLQQLYGDDQRLTMANVPAGGFEVTIEIPFRLEPGDR